MLDRERAPNSAVNVLSAATRMLTEKWKEPDQEEELDGQGAVLPKSRVAPHNLCNCGSDGCNRADKASVRSQQDEHRSLRRGVLPGIHAQRPARQGCRDDAESGNYGGSRGRIDLEQLGAS